MTGGYTENAPLGEAGAGLVVLGAALAKVIEALGHRLAVRAGQGHHTLVHLRDSQTRTDTSEAAEGQSNAAGTSGSP
jgi:hypothetical protein